jgi:hypothetical protein
MYLGEPISQIEDEDLQKLIEEMRQASGVQSMSQNN